VNLYHPIKVGNLDIPGNLFLAPVAGYSDKAFRSICVDQGADFTYTELVSSEALIRDSAKTELLLNRADNEKRYAIQLFGSDPDVMARAAALLEPWHPEVVDINCGCPVPKVVKTGAGSALMKDSFRLGKIVESVKQSAEKYLGGIPVTVKIRSGWDSSSINYQECARIAVEAGAALVALHSRTRAQAYSGLSDWSHIADLAAMLTVPVVGSGDLFTPEDAERMLKETRCAGIMFARGAMGNPFTFSAAKSLLQNGSYQYPSVAEKFAIGFKQLCMSAADIGETSACREMRKQFCAYTKGVEGGAALRNLLVHAETLEDYKNIFLNYGLPESVLET
jgi:nifR3 family TIM-barrel protein